MLFYFQGFVLYVFVVFVFFDSCDGILSKFYEESTTYGGTFVVSEFGLARGGMINVMYNISAVLNPQSNQTLNAAYNSYILLLFLNFEEANNGWYHGLFNSGSFNSLGTLAESMCMQPSLFRKQLIGSGNITYEINMQHDESSRYYAALLQCRTLPNNPVIQIDLSVEMKNPQPYSSEYSHLAIEEVMYTRVLEGEILVFVFFIVALSAQWYFSFAWMKSGHILFLVVLFTQLLYTIAEYVDFKHYDENGFEVNSITYFVNISSHFNTTAILLTLLLVSFGWSFLRPSLSKKEKQLTLGSISLYFFVGLLSAVCLDNSDSRCLSVGLLTYVMMTIIYLGIIVAMNFTVTQLKAVVIHSIWSPTLPLQYIQARQYQFFRFLFLIFVIGPTILFFVEVSIFTFIFYIDHQN